MLGLTKAGDWPLRWVAAILLAYAGSFLMFYPDVLVSADESLYVEQAVAFANHAARPEIVSDYPPGTSLLQAPVVAIGGWRAAAWLSVLGLAATCLMLGRWLMQAGYSPAATVLFLAYPPTLVLGRIGTSDVPSAAFVTAALWLLWTAERRWWNAVFAGIAAGAAMLFRETNAIIVLPFVLGYCWRRQGPTAGLAIGLSVGLSIHLFVYQWLFDTPFFWRPVAGWSLAAVVNTVPIYGFALLVMAPGALIALVAYRGKYRAELWAAVILYLATYVFYDYSGQGSELGVRLAVAGRYLIPLFPLIVIAWADAMARDAGSRWRRFFPAVCGAALVGAMTVHPAVYWWSRRDAAIVRKVLAHTKPGDALIADTPARKYVSALYARREPVWIEETSLSELATVTAAHPSTFIVLVSRLETPSMTGLSHEAERYVADANQVCRLNAVIDASTDPVRRLQLWSVESCKRSDRGTR
jgi:4-amino-4-deoxy-L-arabinose transferase-like glycosyltransferase